MVRGRAWKPPWPARATSMPAAFSPSSRGLPATLSGTAVRMSSPLSSAPASVPCAASLTTWGAVSSRQTTLWPAANRYGLQCSYASLTASPRMCWGTESHPAKLCCPPAHWLYGEATAATGSTSTATYMAAATASCQAGTVSTTAAANSSRGSSSGSGSLSLLTSNSRLTPISLGSSLALPATCDPGRTTSCTAAASNLVGTGRASPLALYTAEATTLGSLSRSATSSAPLSSAQLSSAPGRASLSLPPAPICCEAAGTYKAAATIEPASPGRLSSPVLLCNGAGRALGRGCSSAHGTCVDQPASISSTASQARRSSNETSDPASHSQARTVTLRYCDSFLRSSSTVMLCSQYRLSRLQPPLLCVRATTAVVVTRSCLRCNLQ